MTNHWRDFKNSDVILVIGANPAENHPCGWKWAHVGRDERGTRIIHVDPRFTRTSAIADVFVPIRAGTDTAFFGGLINYVLENELYQQDYVRLHTNASFIVAKDFSFEDGLFSGYDEAERTYDTTTWDYERETGSAEGASPQPGLGQGVGPTAKPSFARVDPTLQDPRCVFQLMREHYSRYTPEVVSQITGIPEDKFVAVAEEFGATGTADKAGSVVYAVGLTHHTSGVQIIRGIGLLQMLLGNVGIPGGGVNAERGHANIQGNTDNAISWEILPGYLGIPRPGMETMADSLDEAPAKQLRPNSINFFGTNYGKFLVSQLKAFFGEAATADNDFAYSWIPKPEKNSSWLTVHDEARAGRLDGIIYGGFTGVTVGPDSTRMAESLANLKWLVIMDPLPTSASEFWHAPGTDPEEIQTEALFLPATAGSVRGGGRRLPRSGAQPALALRRPEQPGARGAGAGGQRLQPRQWRTTGDVRRPGRRRHHRVRGLDLLRFLDRGGQPDGPPRHCRPHGPRLLPRLDLVVAPQPADPLQPGVGRRRRTAVGPHPARDPVERLGVGRGRTRFPGYVRPGRGAGAVHHDP